MTQVKLAKKSKGNKIMLCEYQLANFKAFAGPETISIRPITLIYGPNSSGKSSILQSLLLLKQTSEEAKNPETLLLTKGSLVDLGDYRIFIHQHDLSRSFSFKMILEPKKMRGEEESQLGSIASLLKLVTPQVLGCRIVFQHADELSDVVLSSVELFVGNESEPIATYRPKTLEEKNASFAFRTRFGRGRFSPSCYLMGDEINYRHSFWQAWWDESGALFTSAALSGITDRLKSHQESLEEGDEWEPGEFSIRGTFSRSYRKLSRKELEEEIQSYTKLQQRLENYTFEKFLSDFSTIYKDFSVSFRNFLPLASGILEANENSSPREIWESATSGEIMVSEPDLPLLTAHAGDLVQRMLENIIYIGPLRHYPERYHIFSGNLSEQVGKLGEKLPDLLYQHPEILTRVNAELDRFDLGYHLKMSLLKDEDSNLNNVFAVRVVDKGSVSASIRDVGFGVSQVLPIIVQSLLSRNKTLLIEQPEIHLHPALQAELGDVFIQSALGEQQNTFILETHSEHLILRILRRIRETNDGELEPGLIPIRPEHVAVLYVLPDKNGAKVIEIPIRPDGEFAEQWPQGFFAERAKELF